MTANRRKVLVPLATVLAAGAVAVGSGATFTSETNNTISSVTAGSLKHTNSKDNQAIFNLVDMKPGDTLNGSLTITNTGSLPASFSLTEVSSSNGFGKVGTSELSNLSLSITNTTTGAQVYSGDFGGLVDGSANALGVFQSGAANAYRFTVKMHQDTPNTDQGKTAAATYRWNSVQLDASTYNQ